MRAVPNYMREGSYAMGATRFQTATRVVVPGALSGIAAAYILGISRAVGETMVVAVAAGLQPNLTWDPTEPAATITAFIVQVSLGDLPHGSIGYQSIFAAGLVLMLMTLVFNIAGFTLTPAFPRGVLRCRPRPPRNRSPDPLRRQPAQGPRPGVRDGGPARHVRGAARARDAVHRPGAGGRAAGSTWIS